jgi:thiamine biosynthesis lipoprotein
MDPALAVRVRHAEPVMGTVVSFDVPVTARHDGSLDAAVRWLHWVDRVFSPFRPDSDISLLADAEVTVDACAPEVAEVIEACAFVRELSGGYFTASPGGRFDPSGYVKGWAVERAADILSAAGSVSHLVNGGGDVQCVGGRPVPSPPGAPGAGTQAGDGTQAPWRVGIADPHRPGRLALVVEATDCAIATSGTVERGAHIIDPLAGCPAAGLASLTVVGPSLALADACATAAFAMGPDRARDWAESLHGYEAYAITEAGQTWQTAGFAARIAAALSRATLPQALDWPRVVVS